jgi:hypothetical protein
MFSQLCGRPGQDDYRNNDIALGCLLLSEVTGIVNPHQFALQIVLKTWKGKGGTTQAVQHPRTLWSLAGPVTE